MKFHPILEPLIPKSSNGLFYYCPGCNETLKHQQNWDNSLFWVECSNELCNNEVEILQKPYSDVYDTLKMYIALEESEEQNNNFDFHLEYCCRTRQMIVSDARLKSEKELFRCTLPSFQSLEPSYLRKKIKLYLVLS